MLLSLKRALRVCAAITASLLFYSAFFILLAWLDSEYGSGSPIADPLIETVFFIVGLFFPLAALAYFRHERRSVWIREEAERWLARRAKGSDKIEGSIRMRRILRRMLWIPTLVVLSIFLLFPESMGLVSHLFYPSTIVLNGHRVRPPLLSIISEDPNRHMSALIGRGIVRVGFSHYWHMKPPFWSMEFFAIQGPTYRPLTLFANETATLEKTLDLGNDPINCWRMSRDGEEAQPDFLRLQCRSWKNDFWAYFNGPPKDTSVFYGILERSTESKLEKRKTN